MSKRLGKVRWFGRRIEAWMLEADQIGIRPDEAAQLSRDITSAEQAYADAKRAMAAAREAAAAFEVAAAQVHRRGRRLLRRISTAAELDPAIWELARIKPGSRSTSPASTEMLNIPDECVSPPRGLHAQALPENIIHLQWDRTASGDSFVIERRVGERDGFRFLAITVETEFIDQDVPIGASVVQYRLLARRGPQISSYSKVVEVRPEGEDVIGLAA